jgi:hypothetical protein
MIGFLLLLVLRIYVTGWLITAAAWAVIDADFPMPARTRLWRAITWWLYFLHRPDLPGLWRMLRYAGLKLRYYVASRRH